MIVKEIKKSVGRRMNKKAKRLFKIGMHSSVAFRLSKYSNLPRYMVKKLIEM